MLTLHVHAFHLKRVLGLLGPLLSLYWVVSLTRSHSISSAFPIPDPFTFYKQAFPLLENERTSFPSHQNDFHSLFLSEEQRWSSGFLLWAEYHICHLDSQYPRLPVSKTLHRSPTTHPALNGLPSNGLGNRKTGSSLMWTGS